MTDDPAIAASIMESSAGANPRTQDPVYHITIAFHPDDVVTPETVQLAADRVLAELRLTDHQALMIGHDDRPHAHVHVMVNRVHPDTLVAWDRWRDFVTIDRTLRALERQWDLERVDEPSRSPNGESRFRDRHSLEPEGDRSADSSSKSNTADEAGRRDSPSVPPADPVQEAANVVRAYRAAIDVWDQADDAAEIAQCAEDDRRRWEEAGSRAEQAVARFTAALSQTYADPQYALREYMVRAAGLDYERTRDLYLALPETFGTIRSDRGVPDSVAAARLAARAREAHEAVRSYHVLWRKHGIHRTVVDTADHLHTHTVAAAQRAHDLQTARALEIPAVRHRRLRDALSRLTPKDLNRLRTALDGPAWALVAQTVARLARPLLGHDQPER